MCMHEDYIGYVSFECTMDYDDRVVLVEDSEMDAWLDEQAAMLDVLKTDYLGV